MTNGIYRWSRVASPKPKTLLALAMFAVCPLACGQQERTGTLTAPAPIPLVMNGKQIGSTTIPAGTKVKVLREEAGKTLITTTAGQLWVESGNVKIEEPAERAAPTATPPAPATRPAAAATPAPAKTSVSVQMRASETPPRAVGAKCKVGSATTEFLPSVRIGADAAGQPVKIKVFAIVQTNKEDNGKSIKQIELFRALEQTLAPNVKPRSVTLSVDEWACSCCRFLNKANPKVIGWYAEVLKDGQTLAAGQSSSDSSIKKTIEQGTRGSMIPGLHESFVGKEISQE